MTTTHPGNEALKPCPFCGKRLVKSDTFSNRSQTYFTHPLPGPDEPLCSADNIRVVVYDRDDNELANAWNRRSHVQFLERDLAEAREALKPFALISRDGLVKDDVYTTVTTVSDYFHAASRALKLGEQP